VFDVQCRAELVELVLPALPQADEGSAEPAFVPLAIAPDATAFPEAAGLSLGVIAVEIGADIVLG
jgi:hypothetical protein